MRHAKAPALVILHLLTGALLLGSLGCTETAPSPSPYETGPYRLETLTHTLVRGDRQTPLVAHLPMETRPFPLVVFTPGLALETFRYLPLVERIASHGFVVIRADPPASLSNVDQPEITAEIMAALDWALDPAGPLAGRVDASRVATMGHSLGGKIAAMVAARDARVRAVFAIDPVATCEGPGGGCSEKNPDILPEEVASISVPLGLAGETTDATGGIGGQSCAPEDGNFERFYEAATDATALSPWVASWQFLGANHIDFVDDQVDCIPCLFCQPSTADPDAVRRGLSALATAFFRRHLGDDLEMESLLNGSNLPEGIFLRFQERP